MFVFDGWWPAFVEVDEQTRRGVLGVSCVDEDCPAAHAVGEESSVYSLEKQRRLQIANVPLLG